MFYQSCDQMIKVLVLIYDNNTIVIITHSWITIQKNINYVNIMCTIQLELNTIC